MKSAFRRVLALAGLALLALPNAGAAEVRRVEIDIAGYLCGL
jgi:hypothetical protein